MKKYLEKKTGIALQAEFFDELPLWSAPFGLKLLNLIDYRPSIKALDIGFGAGFPLFEIAMRLGENSLVYGIDPWKEAIARANRKIQYYEIENIRLIEGYAESIPLDNNSVDLIVSNNGINNVKDIDRVFSECSRILKAGGQFVMTMNLDKSMYEFYNVMESILRDLNMDHEIDLMKRHIYHKRRPLEEIITLFRKHDFVIKDLEHDQFNYKFTDGSSMLNHLFIRNAFMDSWLEFLPEEKTSLIFERIESTLNVQSKITNGFKLSIPFVAVNAVKTG